MANTAANVSVGKPKVTGAIYRAVVGTTLPTNASDELSSEFNALGYISEDGLTNSNNPETDNIKAWGGDIVYTTQTEKSDTFEFEMIEALNVEVLKAVYGDANVEGDIETGITIKANSDVQENHSWVIDMILRDNCLKRIVIPSAAMSSLDDITYSDEDPIGYNITLTAVPDEEGQTHYEYMLKSATDTSPVGGGNNTTGTGNDDDGN